MKNQNNLKRYIVKIRVNRNELDLIKKVCSIKDITYTQLILSLLIPYCIKNNK